MPRLKSKKRSRSRLTLSWSWMPYCSVSQRVKRERERERERETAWLLRDVVAGLHLREGESVLADVPEAVPDDREALSFFKHCALKPSLNQ